MLVSGEPILQLWVGHFFEPYLSDCEHVERALEEVKSLGFNTVNLDCKAWADFQRRFDGGDASPYVSMLEFFLQVCQRIGLRHTFLALYSNGDNLYPTIRDEPPIRGEDAVGVDGQSLDTYKYWSPRAQEAMVDHVAGLIRLYGDGMARFSCPSPNLPIQSMFDPIIRPSFDPEGCTRYLGWLKQRYDGEIATLNLKYGTNFNNFEEIPPSVFWLRPEELGYIWGALPDEGDFAVPTPALWTWVDNLLWMRDELRSYFADMKRRFRATLPALFLEPQFQQWGYFFNPPGFRYWQTGTRGLDLFHLRREVDGLVFVAAPLNSEGDPDSAVVSVEYAIARSLHEGGPFFAGLYLGRHVGGDIYRNISPAEVYGSAVAAGARGLHVYGYSGFDDGGVLARMDEGFLTSVKCGNRWAAEVMPLLEGRQRLREVALLFPAQMSLFEPMALERAAQHRMDLLGWFRYFTDLGYHVDIVHPEQIEEGILEDYSILAVPYNSCYELDPDPAMESTLRSWVESGGLIFHGPGSTEILRPFKIKEKACEFDCLAWHGERIVPNGWSCASYPGAELIARFLRDGETGIGLHRFGEGRVVSVGFEFGYAYARRAMPPVPPELGKEEAHPIVLMWETPVGQLAAEFAPPAFVGSKGVEVACFGDRMVLVNHRPQPVSIKKYGLIDPLFQIPTYAPEFLPAHSAVVGKIPG